MHTHCRRNASLSVELLEDRLTPSTAEFVTYLYNNILARAPAPSEVQFWVNATANRPDDELVTTFWKCQEHRTLQVNSYYQNILHRPADSAGLNYWVGQMQAGLGEIDAQSRFYGSIEHRNQFFSNTAFVDDLYATILHRPADAGGEGYWSSAIQGGMTPAAAARGFLDSTERALLHVLDDYQHYYGRLPSNAELDTWQIFLQSTHSELAIDAKFIESPEAALHYASPDQQIALTLLNLHNTVRAQNGLPPLQMNDTLNGTAQAHSDWMAANHVLSHTEGTLSYYGRLVQAGYTPSAGGENILAGLEKPEDVMSVFLGSAPHRDNILNSAYTQVGFGVSRASDGTNYWTVDFATPA